MSNEPNKIVSALAETKGFYRPSAPIMAVKRSCRK